MVSFSGTGSLELTFQDQDSKSRNPLIGGYPQSSGHAMNLTPQNPGSFALSFPQAITKKKKKGREICPNEAKTSKDGPVTLRQEILNWFKNLPLDQRYHVCRIENASWLNMLYSHMFTRWNTEKDTIFCMFNENGPQHLAKELFEFSALEKYCYIRKSNGNCSIGSKKEKHSELLAAEEELIQSLRILDVESYFDTLCIHEKLLDKVDRLFQIFDTISNDQVFININEKQFENPSKNLAWCNPIWFTATSFERFGSWIVSQFERTIILRYFEFKKNPSKLKNLFSDLEYKRKLTDFWKFTKSPKRKKLYITVSKIFLNLKTFQQEKQKLLASETLKDRKYYLYLFYKHFCDGEDKAAVNEENILEKFMGSIHEKDETKFIENLLETPLSRFCTTTNIVARRVSEKLRDCYANKMFETLSQNDKSFQGVFFDEDKSKPAKKKKNKKKKSKSTKTSAASSQMTTPFAVGVDLPQGSTGQPFSLEGDTTESVSMRAADEIETYTQEMAKTLIQNTISSVQALNDEEEKQLVNSETVNTETNEKNDTINSKKNKKKKKKALIFENELRSESAPNKENGTCQESDPKKELEPNESEIELKANVSVAGESNHTFDLSIFDELNKKVSKNKKKKLKKKMKKERLKKGSNLEDAGPPDFMSYLYDTKILRELSFHEKFENATETTCDQMWETTTDGASIRTLLGTVGEANCPNKGKLSSLMSRSETPNHDSDTEEKSVSQYSAVNSEATTDSKMRDEETKEFQHNETSKQSESSTVKHEEKKADKQKERFKLVPKSHKGSNNSSMIQGAAPSLNNSSYIYRTNQSQQLSQSKTYEKYANTQPSECDLNGFTEVKGKKKKMPALSQQAGTSLASKAEQPKTYISKYQYEEKKTKPLQSISRSTQQNITNAADPKEKMAISKIESNSISKHLAISDRNTSVEVNISQETLKELQTQKSYTFPQEKQDTSAQSTLPKPENKKKPLRLNPAAPPLKLSANSTLEQETQKKAAYGKVANHIFDERVEKDIANYVKKLIDESNVLEDCRRVTYNRLQYIIVNSLSAEGSNISIKPYGSCVTGLALNFSDIDIAVSGVYARDREQLLSLLQTIFDKLKVFEWVKDPNLISTATLPVLKIDVNPSVDFDKGDYSKDPVLKEIIEGLTDKQWHDMNLKEYKKDERMQIRIDISIEDGFLGHIGVVSTNFVKKMLEFYEPLFSTALIIKQLLSAKDLLNRFQGGISSYCLIIMLVAYLRTSKQTGIAKSFLECVRYYGKEFDPKTMGINLFFDPNPIYKFPAHPEPSPFYLYDRLRIDRNLGHVTSKIDQILKEFNNIDDYFNNYKQCLEKAVTHNSWSSVQAVDTKVLNSHPELQAFKNKNLFEEMLQVSKFK